MLPQSDSLLWSISGRSCSSGRLVEPFQAPGSRVRVPLENPLFPDTKSDIFSTNFLLPFTIQPLKSTIRNGPLIAGPFFFDYADPMLPVRSSGAYRFGWIAINQPPLWRSYPGTGPFQSPPTSAHGELVEPSATVLRQAQDERMVNFHNFEKALSRPGGAGNSRFSLLS